MGDLKYFLMDNALKNKGEYVFVSDRFKDEKGNVQKWYIVPVTERENEDIIAINEELEEYAEEENLTYIDIYNLLVTEDGVLNTEYTKDGLHLNDKGYDVVTKTLEKYLK